MLTANHLAVIRAALQFWDEEMSPHDPKDFSGYFDEPIGSGEWIKDAVTELRARLSTCRLHYALCSTEETTLISDELFVTPEEAQTAGGEASAMVATVLICKSPAEESEAIPLP